MVENVHVHTSKTKEPPLLCVLCCSSRSCIAIWKQVFPRIIYSNPSLSIRGMRHLFWYTDYLFKNNNVDLHSKWYSSKNYCIIIVTNFPKCKETTSDNKQSTKECFTWKGIKFLYLVVLDQSLKLCSMPIWNQ